MKNLNELIDTLPLIEVDFNFETDTWVMAKPKAFIRDNLIFVSCENGDMAGDYYQDYINPKLVEWAEKNGAYWEWYDGGTICCFMG